MKKLGMVFAVLGVVSLGGSALGSITWKQVNFTQVHGGAVSYDASGDNIAVAGTAFHDALIAGGYLGLQQIGGDGINNPVVGNLGVYGLFSYEDPNNVLAWAMANPNLPLALEFRAWGVSLDFDGDGDEDFRESFTLDAKDMPGVSYLTTTFAELAGWGYAEVAPGVFVDIALSENQPGFAAMSVVIDGFTHAWPDIDATVLPGELQGYTSGITPGSGVRVGAIPEPATFAIWVLLGILAMTFSRRRN